MKESEIIEAIEESSPAEDFRDKILLLSRMVGRVVEQTSELISERFPSAIPTIRNGLDYLVSKYIDKTPKI